MTLFRKRRRRYSERQWSGPASHRRSTTPSRGTLSFDQTFSSYTRTTIDNYERWTLQAGKWSSVVAAHCSMRVSV